MLIRPITFTDLDGTLRTEKFLFNLTIPEVTELELDMPGGMSEYWVQIVERKDSAALLKAYKDLIAKAYGERSSDGQYFLKEDKDGYSLGRMFLQHPAYAALFMELLGAQSTDDAFTEFLRGCIPPELLEKMPENVSLPAVKPPTNEDDSTPEDTRTVDQYSREELLNMPQVNFDKLAGTDPQKWSPSVMQAAYIRKSKAQ